MSWRRAFGLAALVIATFVVGCGDDRPESRLVEGELQPEPNESSDPVGTPAKTPAPDERFDEPIEGVRTVSFPASDDTRLVGTLFGDDQERERGVVLVHRDGGRKGEWYPLALELMDQGYAALAIDLRGHGQSEGRADPAKYASDITAALEILYVNDVNHAAVIGAREGGTASIAAAASWGGPLEAAVTIGSEPSFGDLDVSDEARDLDLPVLVVDDGASELGDLLPNPTTFRNGDDPARQDSGPIVDEILGFLNDHLG